MPDLSLNEILDMQKRLQDRYKDRWETICPENGKNKLLYLVGEIGEVIDVVKKNGGQKASADPKIKAMLLEELSDVLMYFGDVLLCYGISPEELKKSYAEKFEKNMTRW